MIGPGRQGFKRENYGEGSKYWMDAGDLAHCLIEKRVNMCLATLQKFDVQVVDGFVHGFKVVRRDNRTGDEMFQLVYGKNIADTTKILRTGREGKSYVSGFHVFSERESAEDWIGICNAFNERVIRVRIPADKITAMGTQNLANVIICSELYVDSFEAVGGEN